MERLRLPILRMWCFIYLVFAWKESIDMLRGHNSCIMPVCFANVETLSEAMSNFTRAEHDLSTGGNLVGIVGGNS